MFFLIVFFLFVLAFLFLNNFWFTDKKEDASFVPSKELKLSHYFGEVVDFGENYIVLEMSENTYGGRISVKARINEKTEIVDANEIKYVDIPKEYSQNLSFLRYILDLEESYIITCVVESYNEFNKDGDEIYANKINWSIYPEGELLDSKYEKVCEELGIELVK